MSNPDTINSIVNKLLSLPNPQLTLKLNGPNVESKITLLKNRVKDDSIIDFNYRGLAIFLQHIDVNIFSNQELLFLLGIDYSFIENKTLVREYNVTSINKPMYDYKGILFNSNTSTKDLDFVFSRIHNLNKNLSVSFFVSYITSQI